MCIRKNIHYCCFVHLFMAHTMLYRIGNTFNDSVHTSFTIVSLSDRDDCGRHEDHVKWYV